MTGHVNDFLLPFEFSNSSPHVVYVTDCLEQHDGRCLISNRNSTPSDSPSSRRPQNKGRKVTANNALAPPPTRLLSGEHRPTPSTLFPPLDQSRKDDRYLKEVGLDKQGGPLGKMEERGRLFVEETIQLGPFHVPRLFNGFWQLSSPAWGSASAAKQNEAFVELVKGGLNAFDMGDHYVRMSPSPSPEWRRYGILTCARQGDAELIYRELHKGIPQAGSGSLFAATKWCVFRPLNQPPTYEFVLAQVEERCRRVGGQVQLLQFHWHNVSVPTDHAVQSG